jgi:hypothetical protein
MKSIIRNFIAKMVAGRSDDGIMITLKDPKKVDFQTAMMEDLLMRNGIDPRAIKSEQQLKNILNQIEAASKQTTQTGIRNAESAKVFDLKGKEIPKGSKIMGGEAVDDLPPPGSRGGPDDIAAPVQSAEETLKDMIMAENKKNIAAMKNRKMLDDAIEDASPGFANDIKVDADLVAENLAERMGLVYDDLPTKQRLDLYDQAYTGLSKQRFKNKPRPDDDPEDFAKGGIARIGLKEGSGMTRRTFLKFLAGAASIPIVGKIFKPLKVGKTVSKVPIIKTADVAGKPEWFDQLVNKVILEGDDMTKQFATKEREIVHATKIDEDTYVRVTQDLDNGAVRVEYENPDNVFGDPVQMQYKKPLPDEGDPRPSAEFEVSESGPISRQVGPDDYDMDIDEVGGTSIKDLDSDVSKLKEYATGEKPTMKELVQNIKRKDRAKNITEDQEAQMDAVIRRQGEYDGPYDDDFASGGIARMLGE